MGIARGVMFDNYQKGNEAVLITGERVVLRYYVYATKSKPDYFISECGNYRFRDDGTSFSDEFSEQIVRFE